MRIGDRGSGAAAEKTAEQANDQTNRSAHDEPHGAVSKLTTEQARKGALDRVETIHAEDQESDSDKEKGEGDGHFHGDSFARVRREMGERETFIPNEWQQQGDEKRGSGTPAEKAADHAND